MTMPHLWTHHGHALHPALADGGRELKPGRIRDSVIVPPASKVSRRTSSLQSDLIHLDDHGAIEYADNLAPLLTRILAGK